jgi:hypothetical protein
LGDAQQLVRFFGEKMRDNLLDEMEIAFVGRSEDCW